jgi:hypothetical protein
MDRRGGAGCLYELRDQVLHFSPVFGWNPTADIRDPVHEVLVVDCCFLLRLHIHS